MAAFRPIYDLSPALQSRVMEHAAAMIELRKDETLAHGGAPFHHLDLVAKGAFKSVQLAEDGRSRMVSTHWAHEFLALGGFARHMQTTDLVALTTPSVVCEFPVNGQDAPTQVHPAWGAGPSVASGVSRTTPPGRGWGLACRCRAAARFTERGTTWNR